ncbi:hypothetical protein PG999_011451 [Apiospora kogelbergensis]|uniref:Uncharacterized protein n=1 Tax=Apiospora kogelbergensis TaxID=1337665 RepID=A0AAW0QEW1_9PEZI
MATTRQGKGSRTSRKDVATREPNILQRCTTYFGIPGIPRPEISRTKLKRQAEVFAGSDPFHDEQEYEGPPKRRKITKFPIGPLKDLDLNSLPHSGRTGPSKRFRETACASPIATKASKKRERKSKRLITADESTTIGHLELFSWRTNYVQINYSLAASKTTSQNISKNRRQATASRLIFGKGIADVGVWLGKRTVSPNHDLARQFSGEGLIDGMLGTEKTKTIPLVNPRRRPLQQQSWGLLPRTPPHCDTPRTRSRASSCDAAEKSGIVKGTSQGYHATEPQTPVSYHQTPKRALVPTVVTRSMRRSMEARGVYSSLTALP